MLKKSLICPIADASDFPRAVEEAKNYAVSEGLSDTMALRFRLLTEELLGMIGNVLKISEGYFWLENNGGEYSLHLKADAIISMVSREAILKASGGKNEAYRGVKGKMLQAVDFMTGVEVPGHIPMGIYGGEVALSASNYEWSYNLYREQALQDQKAEDWDELELSVLTKLAKDLKVAVRPTYAEVTVIMK